MATTPPISAQSLSTQGLSAQSISTTQGTLPALADAAEGIGQAPALALLDDETATLNPRVAQLPVELDVAVPVRDFRVRNLLALQPEQMIVSQWSNGDDLPLAAGAVRLAWCEFEVVDNQLAVRVTRLD